MSHQTYYRDNEAYAQHLAAWDGTLYAKYADTLRPAKPGGRALDVGCGVGQVVTRLAEAGFEAHGVDVSAPNIELAGKISDHCRLYDGRRLPFPDRHFASAGALNVLEHVDEPEAFIAELVRVVEVGGRVVLSSPNFLRCLGLKDYHPKMRGVGNKWRNFRRLREKSARMKSSPEAVRFDRMEPIVREKFQPDDDAIVATNPVEMRFFLERAGCRVESVSCCDRYVNGLVDFALNIGPWRFGMFNAFLVATRIR